jgi:hypothetical protein
MGPFLGTETQLSVVLAISLLILVKILLIREENESVWIGWFSSDAQSF